MKLGKRLLALLTVAVLSVTSMGMVASAANDDDSIKPSRVRINPSGTRTLVKGKSISFTYEILPSDANVMDDVTWKSSNYDVVDVDDNGYATALEPGTATITVRTQNGKIGECKITVPGKSSQADLDTDIADKVESSKTASSAKPVTSSKPVTEPKATTDTKKIPRETLIDKAKATTGQALILQSYDAVSTDSLRAMADVSKAALMVDTMNGKTTQGRITIAPSAAAKLSGDIKLGVYNTEAKTKTVTDLLAKHYSNKTNVLYCDQANYGMTVVVTTHVGKVDVKNLKFYSYNPTTNSMKVLTAEKATVDENGYVSFPTTVGGYLIISQGALTKK